MTQFSNARCWQELVRKHYSAMHFSLVYIIEQELCAFQGCRYKLLIPRSYVPKKTHRELGGVDDLRVKSAKVFARMKMYTCRCFHVDDLST